MTDIRPAIDAANRTLMAKCAQQDAAGLAGLFTSSGCVMPTNSDIISGAGNIQGFFQGVFDMGIKEMALETMLFGRTKVARGSCTKTSLTRANRPHSVCPSLPAPPSARIASPPRSAKAAWGRCIEPGIRSSIGMWRSRSCRKPSRTILVDWRALNAKPKSSPH